MKSYVYRKVILQFLFVFVVRAFGDEGSNCSVDNLIFLGSIEVTGNKKTNSEVIERELGIKKNDKVCKLQITEGILRLKRMGLFTTVEYNLTKKPHSDLSKLNIFIIEKWTTIPVLKINSGGGIAQYTVGVYDPNVFGEFIEIGGQYENLGGANSGVLWVKNPRLFGEHQGFDFQYWNTRRIRIKYDQEKDDPVILRGFLHEREKVYLNYFNELSSNMIGRISIDYNKDNFSTELLSNFLSQEVILNQELPPSTEFFITKLGFEIGKIDGDPHSLNGEVFGTNLGYAHSLLKNVDSFFQGDLNLNLYRFFYPRWQYAQRFMAGATSTKVVQYWQYLGGLDRIRGFADNRFAGSHFALSNSEIRYLLLEKPSFYLQSVGFLDLAAVGDNTSSLGKLRAASAGGGLRIILPKYYRFVLRLDYAKPIVKNDSMNFSFGVQQFF